MSQQKLNDPISTEDIKTAENQRLQNNENNQSDNNLPLYQHRPLQMIYPQFQNSYYQSILHLNQTTKLKINNWTLNRQHLNYLYFTQTQSYMPLVKNQKIQLFQQHHNSLITNLLLDAMDQRLSNVQNDIIYGNLTFTNNKIKQKSQNPQQQPAQSQHLTPQQLKAYEEQVCKRHKQIIKQQQKQRKRIQNLKLKQQKQKSQNQKKLQEQRKKQQQQMKKHHSEIINKKINQNKQRREKQRKFFEQRNKDYNFILKSSVNNPALYEKMQLNFRKRYQSNFEQDRKKAKSQRQKFLQNSRVEELNIKSHEDKYLRWRSENQTARAAKMQEQSRMVEIYEKQLRKLKRYKSKSNQKDNSDQELSDNEDPNQQQLTKHYKSYHQLKQKIHKLALQKRRKMQTYWQNFVKQQKQPQIDPKKQQELQSLIQSLQKSRKMKKVKNQKGEYVYQQLKPSDPAMKGLEYLEYSRQLGRKRKLLNPKDSQDQSTSVQQESIKYPQKINYLKQLRQSRSSSLNTSNAGKNKFAFLDKKDLTFHDKLQKVERETFKLEQMTKQSQNQLKYGKFKTSQEILQYKEDIDNNHLEILKMKLMLATNGND